MFRSLPLNVYQLVNKLDMLKGLIDIKEILSLVQRVKCGALSTDRPLATELNNLNGLEIMSICAVGSKQSRSVGWRHDEQIVRGKEPMEKRVEKY